MIWPFRKRKRRALPEALAQVQRAAEDAPVRLIGSPLGSGPIPVNARAFRWEDLHEWHPGQRRPIRSGNDVEVRDAPLAFVCPECSMRSGAVHDVARRRCGYCGGFYELKNALVFWWRP